MEENLEVIGLRMFIIIDFGRNRFRCERGLRAPPEARVVEEEEEKEEEKEEEEKPITDGNAATNAAPVSTRLRDQKSIRRLP